MLRASKCNLCYFTTFLMYFSILKLGVILLCMCLYVCVRVCVCEWQPANKTDFFPIIKSNVWDIFVCVCVCVCVCSYMGMQLEKSVSVNVPFDLSHCSCFFYRARTFSFQLSPKISRLHIYRLGFWDCVRVCVVPSKSENEKHTKYHNQKCWKIRIRGNARTHQFDSYI